MNRLVPWLCMLFVLPCAAGAPGYDPFAHPLKDEAQLRALLARPAAKLRDAQVLTGQFQHSRHLREIPKPLVAHGEFTFVRDLGVNWHTRQPFDSVVVLTAAGLTQSDDGRQAQRISADDQPAVRLITNIFMSLFTLDTQSLAGDFDLSGGVEDEKANRWIIGLKPRAGAISSVFKAATVAGSDDVEQVVLTDAHGDRTVIGLTDITYSSDPAGADVRASFALPRQ
jgi:Outer membrane lipoprotein carrier protein LolA